MGGRRRSAATAIVSLTLLLSPSPSASAAQIQDTAVAAAQRLFLDVPYVRQGPKLCGAAALAMVLQYWGSTETQHAVTDRLPEGALTAKGIEPRHLERAAKTMGFSAFSYRGDLDNLKHNIRQGRPVIIELRSSSLFQTFHYVVAIGFDDSREFFLIHDPSEGSFREISFSSVRSDWAHSDNLTMLIVPE